MSDIETTEAPVAAPATPPAQPHLYLVDGSSYIFRAYHRLPPLTNRHGTPAGAVYGYTTMLWKLAGDLSRADGPTHMAVILDASEHTHRNEMYDQYKAHRPPPPEDLVPQFPLIRVATRAFSIPCIEEAGLEADDIIACYVTEAKKQGWKVTIVSSDKDLMQLIDEDAGIDMLDTMNDRRIGRNEVLEKFGVPPEKVGDVLALMGDSVDNVPGVPGIGPKTASQLIQAFGDLETVLASTDQISKPKLKQSLIDHAEMARLSRELVRLVCEAPLPEPLDTLQLKNIPEQPLREFLEDMGFKALLNRLNTGGSLVEARRSSSGGGINDVMASLDKKPAGPPAAEQIEVDRSKYETVTDEAALDRWIAEATAQGYVAIDTETDCIDCIIARLAGVSLATAPNRACYIPVGHSGADLYSDAPSQLPMQVVLDRLRPLLEDPAVLKIGHNFKYDWVMFDKLGIDVAPIDDTMVMSFDLDAGRSFGHGLDELAKLHFDHETIPYKQLCGSGSKQITFDKVPLGPATEYAGEDADIALRLWLRLKPRLGQENVTRVYDRIDRPLVPVLARMERRGIKVDRDYLAKLSREFADETARLEQRIYEAACGPFQIGSTQQLGQVLYERLGLKGGRKGKSGAYSTDVTELERLAAEGVRMRNLGARMAPADQAQVDLYRRTAGPDQPRDGAGPHQLLADRGADRASVIQRPQFAEHPDPDRDRPQDPRRLRGRARVQTALRRLQPDRASARRAHGRRAPAEGSVPAGRRHPQPDRRGTVRPRRPRHAQPGQDDQLCDPLRKLGLGDRRASGAAQGRRQGDHRPLLRTLSRHSRLHPQHAGLRPRAWLHQDFVRTENPFRAEHPLAQPVDPRRRRARGDQRADPGHQRGPHQAGDGADGPGTGGGRPRRCPDAAAGP